MKEKSFTRKEKTVTDLKHATWLANMRRESKEARKEIAKIKDQNRQKKLLNTLEMFEEFADEFEKLLESNK
ncbi:MAG: hypothetical protein A3H54_05045 [Candidatus Yanofskybacteria bacterium RIFCSPLOWO2_02_FULL_41_13]|nr:MAG: hypothetical protein A3H54_05045 [Candidatus Yanofskybacteria bacterium RIFCSPLOWO2_02_FULL_41_13]